MTSVLDPSVFHSAPHTPLLLSPPSRDPLCCPLMGVKLQTSAGVKQGQAPSRMEQASRDLESAVPANTGRLPPTCKLLAVCAK